jgi:hypothetical protein
MMQNFTWQSLSAMLAQDPSCIKQILGIAETKKLVICISMGYSDEKAKLNVYRSIKQKPDEFTRWSE